MKGGVFFAICFELSRATLAEPLVRKKFVQGGKTDENVDRPRDGCVHAAKKLANIPAEKPLGSPVKTPHEEEDTRESVKSLHMWIS